MLRQRPPPKNRLQNIGPIQTVHAVGANHGSLQRKLPSLVVNVGVPLFIEVVLQLIQENRNAVPLHVPALVVEVKPIVDDLEIVQALEQSRVNVAQTHLAALFVYQVDRNLFSIDVNLLLKVLSDHSLGVGVVFNDHFRGVLEVDDLLPKHGDAASGLNVAEHVASHGVSVQDNNLLRFHVVGDPSFVVDTTGEIASP